MADNYLWDKDSTNPTSDVESPPVSSGDSAVTESSDGNNSKCISILTSKEVKLALGLAAVGGAAVGGAAAIGVVLSLPPNKPVFRPDASSASSFKTPVAESKDFSEAATTSIKQPGLVDAQVKMVSPSITNGYETCSSLEKDITEALKLYFTDYIHNEAENNEIYASCDPDDENWYYDYYGYYYGYDDDNYYDVDYECDPASNSTLTCDVKDGEAPWVVVWHEWDHANGTLYYNKTEALEAYEKVDYSFAKRLYCPYKMVIEQYGWMGGSDWCEVETWAYEAQCTGQAPTTAAKKTHMSSLKQTRSSTPLPKETRSRTPSTVAKSKDEAKKQSRSKRTGSSDKSGFGQNSQNDNVNEKDKVVSDGKFIYAAYGDVLQAWPVDDSTSGVSITQMLGDATIECDWNTTVPCTFVDKPSIQAIFLSNNSSRLTVVVSQNVWEYGTSVNQTTSIISDYGTNLVVRVYDTSSGVTPGTPLTELASKELVGSFIDGGSIGDGEKTAIATGSYIDSWALVEDISRAQPQYCGLDKTSYIELATSTAEGQVESLAKQMVAELELISDCSSIFQVSAMQNVSDLAVADLLLGKFVQVFTLDVASADGGDMPSTVAASFSTSYGYDLYMTDDFIALPSSTFEYDYATGLSSSSTFIIGFGISADGSFKPSYYGHFPGEMTSNYQMDKVDGSLRILTSDYTVDQVTYATTHLAKIYVLDVPAGKGLMSVLGESENLLGDNYYITGTLFSGDRAFLSGDDYTSENKKQFVVADLSDQLNPTAVGSLQVDFSISYLQEILFNDVPYILGIGYQTDSTTWDTFTVLALIDVSTPSEPKLAATHKAKSPDSYTDSIYDFLSVRYYDGSLVIPVASNEYNENTYTTKYSQGFGVYDISESAITPSFNVTHSIEENYCYYDADVPSRSFVIDSQLTTVKGHTVINTNMGDGSRISQIDLDKEFNYSVCE